MPLGTQRVGLGVLGFYLLLEKNQKTEYRNIILGRTFLEKTISWRLLARGTQLVLMLLLEAEVVGLGKPNSPE